MSLLVASPGDDAHQAGSSDCQLCHVAGQVDTRWRAAGFGAHPAVTDNCMQLGPVSGKLGITDEASAGGGTRVIGGIASFLVAPAADEEQSVWAAAERAPAAADGTVCSSHWLVGAEAMRLQLRDLQVCTIQQHYECHKGPNQYLDAV